MTNTISKKENTMKYAGQLAVMDAMENGHVDKDELIEYMGSKTFKSSVMRYYEMFKEDGLI